MTTSHKLLLSLLLTLTVGFAAACGKSNEEPSGDDDPIKPVPSSGGAGGDGNASTGGTDNQGTGGIWVEPEREACPDEPDGEQPNSHPPSHRGTPCWNVENCNIVNSEQAKNQCTNSTCVPFDNTARIEGYTEGDPLPPL